MNTCIMMQIWFECYDQHDNNVQYTQVKEDTTRDKQRYKSS